MYGCTRGTDSFLRKGNRIRKKESVPGAGLGEKSQSPGLGLRGCGRVWRIMEGEQEKPIRGPRYDGRLRGRLHDGLPGDQRQGGLPAP